MRPTTSNTISDTPYEFYYSLLRVSMIQLLKGVGFDKSKNSTIDIVTDLYLKFFNLLLREINTLATNKNDEEEHYKITLQDISTALMNVHIIKPFDILDVYESNPYINNDGGMLDFKKWCELSTILHESRIISKPNTEFLKQALFTNEERNNNYEAINDNINNKDIAHYFGTNANNSIPNNSHPVTLSNYLHHDSPAVHLQQQQQQQQQQTIEQEMEPIIKDFLSKESSYDKDWLLFNIRIKQLRLLKERKYNSNNKNSANEENEASSADEDLIFDLPSLNDIIQGSVLSSADISSNEYFLDIPKFNLHNSNANFEQTQDLKSKLPIHRVFNRLDNIKLSYEPEESESDLESALDLDTERQENNLEQTQVLDQIPQQEAINDNSVQSNDINVQDALYSYNTNENPVDNDSHFDGGANIIYPDENEYNALNIANNSNGITSNNDNNLVYPNSSGDEGILDLDSNVVEFVEINDMNNEFVRRDSFMDNDFNNNTNNDNNNQYAYDRF
ncbi:Taf3p SCDLUD_000564 [Saccharomycodes ludwigii]|uniref:Taf3p n=1 Tax=Saccharomycodes ludwigii TaxID=36035 RepID=UPI001E8C1987|nr:hypothetical protein SCDLUD_000564 [Saccharomycodes ludwigii]KAH3902964.1 hypothetical protein SCDLUD_000564 [Saccharomycodes ludwigii]